MLDGNHIFKINSLIAKSGDLSLTEMGWLLRLVDALNDIHWNPVRWPQSIAMRGMSKNSFLDMRRRLVLQGWIKYESGEHPRTAPTYNLGPRFTEKDNKKKDNMRTRDEIKELVVSIDKKYPDFAEMCSKYTWDNALESFKISHPEVGVWEADSIGDPVNRKQAHEMFKYLHKAKKTLNEAPKQSKQPKQPNKTTVWTPFYLFVEEWLLTYPKRAKKSDVMAAVEAFTKDKMDWTEEQVKDLQERILSHTAAYLRGDLQYVCAPHNYFAKEQWLEKVFRRGNDTDDKHAGGRPGLNPNFKRKVTKVN